LKSAERLTRQVAAAFGGNPVTLLMRRILGCLTLLGLMAVGIAISLRFKEVAYPTPIILLSLGAGCFLLAGSAWAHTPGMRRVKAAVLGLVGFAVGGVSGFFLGDAMAPKRPDDMSGLIFAFGAMWIGGTLFGVLGVRRIIQFHRRYVIGPPAAPDQGQCGA
jgi:hypothetical protein